MKYTTKEWGAEPSNILPINPVVWEPLKIELQFFFVARTTQSILNHMLLVLPAFIRKASRRQWLSPFPLITHSMCSNKQERRYLITIFYRSTGF